MQLNSPWMGPPQLRSHYYYSSCRRIVQLTFAISAVCANSWLPTRSEFTKRGPDLSAVGLDHSAVLEGLR